MTDEMSIVREFRSSGAPIDVAGLIKALGLNYVEQSMATNESGRIEFDGDSFSIFVNANEEPQRRRLIAAHELAHYLLHRDLLADRGLLISKGVSRHDDSLFGVSALTNPSKPFSPTHEVQANQYAAELLMPASYLKRQYNPDLDNFLDLARELDVSNAAMRIRLSSLGLRETAE